MDRRATIFLRMMLDGKEAKPKDDLVKEPDEDDIFGFDDGDY